MTAQSDECRPCSISCRHMLLQYAFDRWVRSMVQSLVTTFFCEQYANSLAASEPEAASIVQTTNSYSCTLNVGLCVTFFSKCCSQFYWVAASRRKTSTFITSILLRAIERYILMPRLSTCRLENQLFSQTLLEIAVLVGVSQWTWCFSRSLHLRAIIGGEPIKIRVTFFLIPRTIMAQSRKGHTGISLKLIVLMQMISDLFSVLSLKSMESRAC